MIGASLSLDNPNRKESLYNLISLHRMLVDRLWGEGEGGSWSAMRDIFIEPIVENLLRRQMPLERIDGLIACGKGWTRDYVRRRWGFKTSQDAKNFFLSHYLGLHEVNDYLD